MVMSRKLPSVATRFRNAIRYRPPQWVMNKYFIVGLSFAVFVTFFDSYNILERNKLSRQLRQARQDMRYYEEEIVQIQRQRDELQDNDITAEKFARERYLMKRADEDVFVILPAE